MRFKIFFALFVFLPFLGPVVQAQDLTLASVPELDALVDFEKDASDFRGVVLRYREDRSALLRRYNMAGSLATVERMHLFTFWNYVPPFVAHAFGTLVGAFLAVKLAASHHGKIAFGIGVFFLFGGMVAASMIGGSKIFISVDLVFAYIPMAILGQRFAGGAKSK